MKLSFIILISIVFFSNALNIQIKSSAPENYTDNLIQVNFGSNLTKTQKDNYLEYVRLKIKFNVKNSTVPLINYYQPQKSDYEKETYKIAIPFFSIGAFFLLLFILYLLLVLLNKFKGPKSLLPGDSYGTTSKVYSIIGFIIAIVFISTATVYNFRFSSNIATLGTQGNQIKLNQFTNLMNKLQTSNSSLEKLTYTFTQNNTQKSYIKSLYRYNELVTEINKSQVQAELFLKKNKDSQNIVLIISVSVLSIFVIITIISIVFYRKRKILPLRIASYVLFFMNVCICVIMGLAAVQFDQSVDICQNVDKLNTGELTSIYGFELGYYFGCPTKTAQYILNTAVYENNFSFNLIYNDLNAYLKNKFNTSFTNKRYNKDFENYIGKFDDANIDSGLNSLINFNNNLEALDKLRKCSAAVEFTSMAEEKYCQYVLKNILYSILFWGVSIIGIIFMSIGLNRISTLFNLENNKDQQINLLDKTMTTQ